jgi:hypothetical protein
MTRKVFLVAALFAAFLSTASAQFLSQTTKRTSTSYSWLGQSTDVPVTQLIGSTWEAADYLMTAYVNMSNDSAVSDPDVVCPSLTFADEFDPIAITPPNALAPGFCAQEPGSVGAPALRAVGTSVIHVAGGSPVSISTNGSVAAWLNPHTYDLIVTVTKLNQ